MRDRRRKIGSEALLPLDAIRFITFAVLGALLFQLNARAAIGQTQWVLKEKHDILVRLPGAVLLTGYPPNLYLTSGDRTLTLYQNERDSSLLPSMATDGTIVALGRSIESSGFYPVIESVSDQRSKWVERQDLHCDRGGIAISPDGSKLALRGTRCWCPALGYRDPGP
jgi:hypothetical protein